MNILLAKEIHMEHETWNNNTWRKKRSTPYLTNDTPIDDIYA
jgi:hypothetical protein